MGKKGGGGEAAAARADEQARQDKIRQGTQRINSIFDGQTVGANPLAAGSAYDPNAKYYLNDGSLWSPAAAPMKQTVGDVLSGGKTGVRIATGGATSTQSQDELRRTGVAGPLGGQNGRDTPAPYTPGMNTAAPAGKTTAEQFAEALAGGKIYSGTQHTGGFGDDYFTKQRQNFIDYATPQLDDQKGEASKQLTFALSRSGLLNSSARAQKEGDLQKTYDLNKQDIADKALSYETQARNNVEDARSNLIATLNATGDAEGASQSAIHRAAALSQPAAYSPLSNLFADFTNGLGTQAAMEKANYYSGGQTGVRYNTGLFGPKNAVKVS